MKVGVYKLGMASPNDTAELAKLLDAGDIAAQDIVAVIGKTEGNGGANDFTRGYATQSYLQLLSERLSMPAKEVAKRVCFVWSGGTEGVLSPHATVFTRQATTVSRHEQAQDPARLALGIAVTDDLLPEQVGTVAHVKIVAQAVHSALKDAGINDPRDVHYVQVKGPLLTPAAIASAQDRGVAVVTRDPNGSKPYARGAMALGVAIALGEVDESVLEDSIIGRRMDLFSRVASTSAGGELTNCEVLLFGNSREASSEFVISHAVLADAIDAASVRDVLSSAGLQIGAELGESDKARIVSVFAKADVSPTGRIRGRRTTMLSDADINYERHGRAAVGAVIASITGDPAIFVSGGTEHQCALGEMPIAAIVRV